MARAQGILTNESMTVFAIIVIAILAGVFMFVIVTKLLGVNVS